MSVWKKSRYTTAFQLDSDTVVLHNCFMGALARVPAQTFSEIEALVGKPDSGKNPEGGVWEELCTNGFYSPTDLDERSLVEGILSREGDHGHQDLIILPHEDCNFRCVYCYESHAGGRMTAEVAGGLKRFVETGAQEWSSLHTRWFGGEPLLAQDLVLELSDAFLESCARHGLPYRSQMTTNAYLLNPKALDALLPRKIQDFQITLDGPGPVHDTTRFLAGGGRTFQTIYDNLLAMKARREEFTVSVRINFNPESLPLMDAFFETLAQDFGEDIRFGIYFRPIGKYGGPNDDHLSVCESGVSKIVEMDLSRDFARHGNLDRLVQKSLVAHGQVCYASKKNSLVVGSDGTLYKCSVAFEDPANHVGHLRQDGTLELDRDRWQKWVSTQHLDCKACEPCPVFPLCQGKYCPRSSLQAGKPVCPMTRTTYAQLVQLAAEAGNRASGPHHAKGGNQSRPERQQ